MTVFGAVSHFFWPIHKKTNDIISCLDYKPSFNGKKQLPKLDHRYNL